MNPLNYVLNAVKNLRKYSFGITQVNLPGQPVYPKINDEALVKKYRGWTYISASRNAAAVASTPIRLYATVDKGEAMPRSRSGRPGRKLDGTERAELVKRYGTNKRISTRLLRG